MPELVLLWMLIVIPITGTVPIDTIKQLCVSDVTRKAIIEPIVIADDETKVQYMALKVKCYRIQGDKV